MSGDRAALLLRSLGEVISRLRKEKKLSQGELGKLAGTSQMTINRLESAMVGTRIDNLVSIADGLEIKLTDLFALIEGSTSPTSTENSKWAAMQAKVNQLTATEREWIATLIDDLLQSPWKRG